MVSAQARHRICSCYHDNIEQPFHLTTCPNYPGIESAELQELLARVARVLTQRREDSHKLYSIHAPEVECIAKGKAHKKYEFGVKVSVAMSTQSNFVVGMCSLAGNPYDGHTLSNACFK